MDDSTSREKILKKVRAALLRKSNSEPADVDFDSPVFHETGEPLEIHFAQQFTELNGQFVFCENEDDFCYNIRALAEENKWEQVSCAEPHLQLLLKKAGVLFQPVATFGKSWEAGITGCEYLVARTGSIVLSSKQESGRRGYAYPDHHIVVARTSQLVYHLREALKAMKTKYPEQLPSQFTIVSGPSRTADIEKTLVQGAHGPKEIYLFLIDDSFTA